MCLSFSCFPRNRVSLSSSERPEPGIHSGLICGGGLLMVVRSIQTFGG